MSAIICTDLCKYYQQGDAVIKGLDHVSLEIEEGSFICLSGPSGSGKTTLLNAIGGLDSLDSGQIAINGERVDLLGKAALADLRLHSIGFVFQAYNLIPVMTAYENAEFVLKLQGVSDRECRDRVMGILKQVGLDGLENRRPDEMSGGQQQRVAIARAIVTRPAIVLADEPTANVDSATANALLDLMQQLNQEYATTFLFSTHDRRVMDLAHRLIRLRDGKIDSDEVRH